MVLHGNTAIVTGGGRGIGRSTALALAREGCNVVVSSRSGDQLATVTAEAERLGVGAMGLALDLARDENIRRLVDATIERFGEIGILVNNAAVLMANDFPHVSTDEWDKTMEINLRSVFLLSQRALESMKRRGSGYIINVSSPAGLRVSSRLTAYGVSKAAVAALSQAAYDAAVGFGIKVSTIYPGYVDTEMLRSLREVPTEPSQWARPEDIADCVLFLLKQSDRIVVKDLVALAFQCER